MRFLYSTLFLLSFSAFAPLHAQTNSSGSALPAPAVESSPALDDRGELTGGGGSMGQRGSNSGSIGQRGTAGNTGSVGSSPAITTPPGASSIVNPNQGGMSTGSSATQSGNIIPSPNTPSVITPDDALRNRSSNPSAGGIRTDQSLDGGMR